VAAKAQTELSAEQRREIAAWFEANSAKLPESVRIFMGLHQEYLAEAGDPRRAFESAYREIRRALRITPSSEKRKSGSPLATLPPQKRVCVMSARERLEERIERTRQVCSWHDMQKERRDKEITRLEERLTKMRTKETDEMGQEELKELKEFIELIESARLEDVAPTPEEQARADAAADRFIEHVLQGDGPDPAMQSVNETLMPAGAVLASEKYVSLPAILPPDLADATVVKTINEQRVRHDFSMSVTRIELDVEKKVVVDQEGERHVITASTAEYGPPRYSVTWQALATLAILVAQFALPFNRLATMVSVAGKRFTAGALSRMLHYVAERLVPIYLELARQLADCEILAGDDTSCRVLEVSRYFRVKADQGSEHKDEPPWAAYQTPRVAEESLRLCEELQKLRVRLRLEGDRQATRTSAEIPSLGTLIGRHLVFESPRRNGDGAKQSMHTTVISGRASADDPRSLTIFYRSHLGGCGDLLESILESRNPSLRKVVLQGDLSTTNLITSPELLARFDVKQVGCSAHARRPFAVYEHEDRIRCGYMVTLFQGLAIDEQRLDVHGRNRENVLAVRGNESRQTWNDILKLAKKIADVWSKGTKLGTAARYIIKHFEALTAYLDDPRLEATNNLRERMLRMEKLIEGSSMFRRSLEGRFVLDVVRSVLQTAVAAGVPVHEYLVSVLRTSHDEIAKHPDRFTPRAWAAANLAKLSTTTPSETPTPP
jgi:hypothetical protein